MSGIRIVAPACTDAEEVLAFEVANRAFFERHVNARPADYYAVDRVREAIARSIREADEDHAYQYLIRDSDDTLIGRINLTRVRRAHFHCAELGYRIGEASGGRGHATAAVGQVVARAFQDLKLLRLEARARVANVGSNRVLSNNDFGVFGRANRSFELAGVWHDVLCYERRAES